MIISHLFLRIVYSHLYLNFTNVGWLPEPWCWLRPGRALGLRRWWWTPYIPAGQWH